MTTKILTAAGVASFIGYSIYFDWKRRSAPDYKMKIRESIIFFLIKKKNIFFLRKKIK